MKDIIFKLIGTSSVIVSMIIALALMSTNMANAQSNVIECGDIVEGQLTQIDQTIDYTIQLAPGDSMQVQGEALGDRLGFQLGLFSPAREPMLISITSNNAKTSEPSPFLDTGIISASGNYTLQVYNDSMFINGSVMTYRDVNNVGAIGVYTLYINCTLRDGSFVEAGSSFDEGVNPSPPGGSQPSSGAFVNPAAISGLNAVEIPISGGQAITGAISGNDVFAYTFSSTAGSASLTVSRVSGDLSIGVLVTESGGDVVFLAGMPSSGELTAELDLEGGDYSINIFRLDVGNTSGTSGAFEVIIE